MTSYKVEISNKTIIYTITLLLSLWFLYQIRSILVMIFVAFILMTAVTPIIKLTNKLKIPSMLVMVLLYIALIALISTLVASLVPAVISQTKGLTQSLPDYLHRLELTFNTQFDPSITSGYLSSVPTNLLKIVSGTFSNLLNILTLFFMSYYLLIERPHLHKYLMHLLPDDDREKTAEKIVNEVEKGVGGWVRGELLLMAIVGGMTYIGLAALGVPYVLPLAVLAGLLEAVPNIGPTVAAVPATILGFTVSPIVGFGALAMSILVQQLEGAFIVPRVMQSATGAKPIITLTALIIGYTMGGVTGAVLAMPLYLTLAIVITNLKK